MERAASEGGVPWTNTPPASMQAPPTPFQAPPLALGGLQPWADRQGGAWTLGNIGRFPQATLLAQTMLPGARSQGMALYSEMVAQHLSLTPLSPVKVRPAKALPKLLGSDRQGSSGRFQEKATGATGTMASGRCIRCFSEGFLWAQS